ncbi:MAG: hypothetical protein ACREKH_09600 [Candidatus Rokuibacteriota bacterium]
MQPCDQCGARAPLLPVRIDVVRESGPIKMAGASPLATANFTRGYAFCSAEHAYAWARERRYMLCNRQPTPFEAGMQPYLPSRHLAGRIGLCDGHHLGGHEWTEAWPG